MLVVSDTCSNQEAYHTAAAIFSYYHIRAVLGGPFRVWVVRVLPGSYRGFEGCVSSGALPRTIVGSPRSHMYIGSVGSGRSGSSFG